MGVLLAVAVVAVACGGGGGGGQAGATGSPFSTVQTASSVPPQHATPRWEVVTTLSGAGSGLTEAFSIDPGSIQWRVRWRCESGTLAVAAVPAPSRGGALVEESSCPGAGEGYSVEAGQVRLDIQAAGAWEATVEQQVDTPVDEAPLPGMTEAPVLAQGDFYDIENEGEGTARLHRLPDGRLALRLEGFRVTNNTDLFVWLSEAPAPTTSAEVVQAPHVQVAELTSTIGNQNYLVPTDLGAQRIRSVVIWCEPVRVAYAAATLAP
ncbi:MAG: DM13 domain-containing protein [Acidimicrobiales bacterium]